MEVCIKLLVPSTIHSSTPFKYSKYMSFKYIIDSNHSIDYTCTNRMAAQSKINSSDHA